jgi:hypothetical protein
MSTTASAKPTWDDGDNALAITSYQKSLELDPKNVNAVQRIRKLNDP